MADPRCERALQEFQANPDKALITYQHDKYIQEFFREFCDVLGECEPLCAPLPDCLSKYTHGPENNNPADHWKGQPCRFQDVLVAFCYTRKVKM